jgi:hypothetical protein
VDENQADGHDVDQEDDGQRAGDLRTAVIHLDIAAWRGGGGDALFAVAGDGAEAAENALGDRGGV